MLFQEVFDWSERITLVASNVLNRGADQDRIELRKLIAEWLEKYEPVIDDVEKGKVLVIKPLKPA